MQYKIMVAQFPYDGTAHTDATDWVAQTIVQMHDDPRLRGGVMRWKLADTPITMSRNRCLAAAQEAGVDYVLMVDSDMKPDLDVPGAKPFWPTAWEFMQSHAGPCVIAAPYCGKPPHENVFIFRWENLQSDNPNADFQLKMYSRHEGARATGIERVAALPTGLMLIDMRAVNKLLASKPKPEAVLEAYKAGRIPADVAIAKIKQEEAAFYYEWTDNRQTHKASTEDVTFSRDLSMLNIPLYVTWDCWAGHHKDKVVSKPSLIDGGDVQEQFLEAARREIRTYPEPCPPDVAVCATDGYQTESRLVGMFAG